jgi:TolB-like protein/tetratricopeptide (TPR) repeat protein
MNARLSFFAALKQRKLVQWAVAYGAAAFALLQGIDIVAQRFAWPEQTMRFVIIALSVGLFVTLVLAWYHGERGAQRVSGTELIIIGLVLAVGGGFLWYFAAASRLPDHKTAAASLEGGAPATPPDGLAGARPSISEKSIAVLPFDNLSRDPDNAFFAEGVQDEILTRLAKVADLKVISRTSTQRFKSAPEDLRQIAKQLGVTNILEGSVQKSNDQVRVNVQLINAMTDAHLWAETYDRKLTDMFTVESEIAKAVADNLRAKLTGREIDEMSVRPTEDPIAHDLLVKGRYCLGLRRGDNLPRAIDFFQQVIARDPNYAAAYAGLGEAYTVLPRYTAADRTETFFKAKTAALKAMELDPKLAEAHNVLAKLAYDKDLDFAASEREFKRAIELNPNYAGAHHWYSGAPLESSGRFEEAIAEGKRGVELDPLSAVNLTDLGRIYSSARRYSEAKVVFEKAVALDPDFSYAHWHYGEMLQVSGDLKGAAAEYARARVDETHPEPISLMGQLGAKMGRPEEAREALRVLLELRKERTIHNYWFALLHLALNDKEEALRCLEQSYEAGNSGYEFGIIKFDGMLDGLRGEPRFEALVEKITASKTKG